jgi:hypothetical protein
LFFERLHNAAWHWTDGSKKDATLELRKDILVHPRSRYHFGCIPKKCQLARANVEYGIFIANLNAAKLDKVDILRAICVPEPELGSLVEMFDYVGYIP